MQATSLSKLRSRDGRPGPGSQQGTAPPGAFCPPAWLRNPHLQTTLGRQLRRWTHRHTARAYVRQRIETPDGDFVDLDHFGSYDDDTAPPVLVVHGLQGCSSSGSVLEACRALAARRLRPVAFNFRSRSGEPNRRARSYHAGATEDLALALSAVAGRHPGLPVGALGFSLGGNALLKLLAEREVAGARDVRLEAAVAVSVPFDLARAAAELERGVGRLYARFFLRSLRTAARARAERHPAALDLDAALGARTLREFDDAVTAPLHGFRDAAHYYARCSSGPVLGAVRTRTLLLHALDDPLAPGEALPRRAVEENPFLSAEVTRHGGHVGFVARREPGRSRFWAEERAATFLAEHLLGPGG